MLYLFQNVCAFVPKLINKLLVWNWNKMFEVIKVIEWKIKIFQNLISVIILLITLINII